MSTSYPIITEASSTDLKMQLLMEQFGQQGTSFTWNDLLSIAKKNMMEKRNVLDVHDRSQLQEAISHLQQFQHVATRKDLISHLKDVAASADLKCTQSSGMVWLSAETFYLELKLNSEDCESFSVKSVQLVHADQSEETAPFSELLRSLVCKCDWTGLIRQLSGLNSFYSVGPALDRNTKVYIFTHFGYQNADIVENVNENPIGLSQKREAGRPFRLFILINPYDLIDLKSNCFRNPSIQDIFDEQIGDYLEMTVDSDGPLPNQLLLMDGCNSPPSNISLPVCFSLRPKEPFIIADSILSEFESTSGIALATPTDTSNILHLLKHGVQCETLTVHLPDQHHEYVLDLNGHRHLLGGRVHRINFDHPRRVSTLVRILRRQLLFNHVFRSCVRRYTGQCWPISIRIDLACPSVGRLDCLFELPKQQGHLVLVEFSCSSVQSMSVTVESVVGKLTIPDFVNLNATTAFKQTWSVPVTLRLILMKLGYDPLPLIAPITTKDGTDGPSDNMKPQLDKDEHQCFQSLKEHQSFQRMYNTNKCFWFSSEQTAVQLASKIGNSWLSLPYHSQKNDLPILLNVAPVDNYNQTGNLLDLFKEIDLVSELVPPRADQEPLKSPTPSLHSRGMSQLPSPRLHDIFGCRTTNRVQSETTMALKAFSDLEAICDLATSNFGDSFPETTVSRPNLTGDNVVRSPVPGFCMFQSGNATFNSPDFAQQQKQQQQQHHQQQQQQQQRMMQMTRPGKVHLSQPSSMNSHIRPALPMNRHSNPTAILAQSKSVDYDFMGQQMSNPTGTDPFAFPDCDELGGSLTPSKLASPSSVGLFTPSTSFVFPGQYQVPGSELSPPLTAGRGSRGTGKRRGRGRKASNMGDREGQDMPFVKPARKPRNPNTPRKPRKPRGAAAAVGTVHADIVHSTSYETTISAVLSANSSTLPPEQSTHALFLSTSSDSVRQPTVLISQKCEPSKSDVDRRSSNETNETCPKTTSVLESLVMDQTKMETVVESGERITTANAVDAKPNILKTAGSRRVSLDAVIGKIRARSTMADVFDDETNCGIDDESSRDSVFGTEPLSIIEQDPSNPELKVVIKKTLLTKTHSQSTSKVSLAHQKSLESISGIDKFTKQRLPHMVKAKPIDAKKGQKRKATDARVSKSGERKMPTDNTFNEGITFALSKPLKKFKIPKVADEVCDPRLITDDQLMSVYPPSVSSIINKQPIKSILKHHTPPMQTPPVGTFQPLISGRKPLLPSPNLMVHHQSMLPGLATFGSLHPLPIIPKNTVGDQPIESPDDSSVSIRSPDQSVYTIDESATRSPSDPLTGTSKDIADDRSPELKIVEND